MWDFFWHLRGSTHVHTSASNEEVLDRIERFLERERKPVAQRGSDTIVFHAPFWGELIAPNWLAMAVYDHGRFWIEPGVRGQTVRYDLSSLHALFFCLFGAGIFFVFGLFGGSLSTAITFAGFAFGWIYGMNMVLAWARIPKAIRDAVNRP
jgi:hypothetical protein